MMISSKSGIVWASTELMASGRYSHRLKVEMTTLIGIAVDRLAHSAMTRVSNVGGVADVDLRFRSMAPASLLGAHGDLPRRRVPQVVHPDPRVLDPLDATSGPSEPVGKVDVLTTVDFHALVVTRTWR